MIQHALDLLSGIPAPITLIIGVVLLLAGGHWLVEGSVRIARSLGVSTLLIGLTVVAFGTSSPELAFNITAAINGNGELSFGNVVGSNIANIALVLGLAALISPLVVHGRVVQKELPLLICVSAVMLLLAWMGPKIIIDGVSQMGFGRPAGLIMLAGFAFVTWLWFRMGRRDRADPLTVEAQAQPAVRHALSMPIAVAMFLIGLAALVVGGKLTEMGAIGIARIFGLSEALIGLTIIALATSLPEVVTSLVACRKGHTDLAVGNIVGSNLFNILLVLGVTSTIAPVPVPPAHGWWDLLVMLGLTLMLLPISISNHRRIMKAEGLLLLLCYAAYIGWAVAREMMN